ncbi:hypothetical protein BDZ45DRAFT_748228 [Acephala macrosclerotiorum]|nr:hypothetical protein BDZ45DRAFT_748228 [Acephala macrosclerotiorum]
MADTLSSIKDLLDSKKYSDLTLKCKGKGFKVYRAIVCTRSAFLSKAIDGDFKEATLGEIDLSADELSVIEAMIKYLYTDDYPDTALVRSDSTGATSSMIGAPLSSSNIDNAYALLFNVKIICRAPLENTVESDRELRTVVVQAAYKHIKELLDRGEFGDVMKNHGDFAYDVVRVIYGRPLGVASEGVFRSKAILGRDQGIFDEMTQYDGYRYGDHGEKYDDY